MAGEIEEPIRLDFQADSIHSGSISFGRFETEALCWERRSSFSHNRYLEEVEKCSKPGLVTEKKAYFEAHFRKKGILSLLSPENKTKLEINHVNEETSSPCFDESIEVECAREVFGTTIFEPQIELSCDINNDTDFIPVRGEIQEAPFPDKDIRVSSPKEKIRSECISTKPPRLMVPRVSVEQSKRYISSKASKGSEKTAIKTINNVHLRLKPEKKTSEAAAKDKRAVQKTPKYEPGSKAKRVNEIKRVGKESRNRITVEPRSSAVHKVSSRVRQSLNRIKPNDGTTVQCTKQDSSRFSLRNDERAGRRKEFDLKLEEKKPSTGSKVHQIKAKTQIKAETEIKQLRKSLNFKATPMPSFYRGALRESDTNKAISSNVKPRTLRMKSSSTGTPYPPQASGGTSCNSTVTSESSPSSPAAETCITRLSQARKNTVTSGKKEKDMSLRNHKAPESNSIYKAKRMGINQKTRIERSNNISTV